MGQITEFPFLKKFIPLAKASTIRDNCFTVILGKNGVGKSRLLAELVNNFSKPLLEKSSKYYTGQSNFHPSKIIAVSTSPFDKFPPARKDTRLSTIYSYVGMRTAGIQTSNQMALIVSAAKGLMEKYLESEQNENLTEIFNLLSLSPNLNFIFRLNIKKKYTILGQGGERIEIHENILPDHLSTTAQHNYDLTLRQILDEAIFDKYISERIETRSQIRSALTAIWDQIETQRGMFFKLKFDYSNQNKPEFTSREIVSAILILLNHNILKLYDLKITKKTNTSSTEMSLRRASSGEQCLLVMILGIAGHIKNNSLVLIDEPEISLHPSWQARFMDLIINIFNKYKDCHFIIATHSPQIVSRLAHDNCFITTMGDNTLHLASDFHHRSADFQLAELFDAPGIMNEYVSRISFTLLTKVKSQKYLDDLDRKSLIHLKSLRAQLDKDDPNRELIESVSEVCAYYATNNS